MKAKEYSNQRIRFADGSMVSIVIWTLPQKDDSRTHAFKYRLQFSGRNGETLIRYDNERGKGDHKHVGNIESSYLFESVDKLVNDFWRDVDEARAKKSE